MKTVRMVLEKFSKFLQALMILCLAVMVIVMFMQVFMRYVMQMGFVWAEELARFLMIYMVFIGAAVLANEKSHISVTILEDFLHGVSRKIVELVQYAICLAYCFLMVRIGVESLDIVRRQTSPNMRITMDLVYMIIPIANALMIVFMLNRVLMLFFPKPEEPGQAKEVMIGE